MAAKRSRRQAGQAWLARRAGQAQNDRHHWRVGRGRQRTRASSGQAESQRDRRHADPLTRPRALGSPTAPSAPARDPRHRQLRLPSSFNRTTTPSSSAVCSSDTAAGLTDGRAVNADEAPRVELLFERASVWSMTCSRPLTTAKVSLSWPRNARCAQRRGASMRSPTWKPDVRGGGVTVRAATRARVPVHGRQAATQPSCRSSLSRACFEGVPSRWV